MTCAIIWDTVTPFIPGHLAARHIQVPYTVAGGLKGETQARIAATGRRVELGRAVPIRADALTNLNPGRALTVVRPPEPAVIQKALGLYQEALRRPSLTALCLDVSGSMQGTGEKQLLEAMQFLLTPARTREVLVLAEEFGK